VDGLILPGVRTTPLGGYLAGLGLLSAVTRLLDANATGSWRHQAFVLGSRFATPAVLAAELAGAFCPEPIVSPWNLGSGFAGNRKSPAAEKALDWARHSTDPRLAGLRAAVEAGDAVMAEARARGWEVSSHKAGVLQLCRNRFPDRAVRWLDAAVALGGDGDPSFSRLLGTGGNLGRLDLSATYLQRAADVLSKKDSVAWLESLLDGQPRARLPRSSFGQYDPASAGNPEDAGEVGNPWLYLLLIEGALLFATAVVRRHGAEYAHAALPFQVRATTAGLDSAAPGENAMAELWAPEWSTPCTVGDVEQLLGEGRAEWRDRPARSGLDFARAVASLGVDRGIDAFQRHVFAERLGQSPLAVPAGRVLVARRGGVWPLAGVDLWLDRVNRVGTAGVTAARRAVEQALYQHACTGRPADLAAVFEAVGRCHETVARSGTARDVARPLVLTTGTALFDELLHAARQDTDLRVALGLACARDPGAAGAAATLGGLRPLLSPVGADQRGLVAWTRRPAPASLGMGLYRALCEAARRRGFPHRDTTADPAGGDEQDGGTNRPAEDVLSAVAGVPLGFARGPALSAGDLWNLATGAIDARRCASLLAGLLTVDWSRVGLARLPAGNAVSFTDPAIDLLVPFTGDGHVEFATPEGVLRMRLLPGPSWPGLLRAGHSDRVLDDAARRLRINGLRQVIAPAASTIPGDQLAGVLLARTTPATRTAALGRVAVLPDPAPATAGTDIGTPTPPPETENGTVSEEITA
jgi:CRISPR-associated protein Csx17